MLIYYRANNIFQLFPFFCVSHEKRMNHFNNDEYILQAFLGNELQTITRAVQNPM